MLITFLPLLPLSIIQQGSNVYSAQGEASKTHTTMVELVLPNGIEIAALNCDYFDLFCCESVTIKIEVTLVKVDFISAIRYSL